jgi:hypothetical protein
MGNEEPNPEEFGYESIDPFDVADSCRDVVEERGYVPLPYASMVRQRALGFGLLGLLFGHRGSRQSRAGLRRGARLSRRPRVLGRPTMWLRARRATTLPQILRFVSWMGPTPPGPC